VGRGRRAAGYLDAFRDLVLPQTEVLVGGHQTLCDFLLPDWEGDRPASPRELAVAASKHGTRHVLVTSVPLPDQFLDNVLASSQGAITGEKFERFEVSFVGAGDTLAASLAALLATGADLHAAVGEALAFLDRPSTRLPARHSNVIPDRFFWALPPAKKGARATPPTRPTTRAPRRYAMSTDAAALRATATHASARAQLVIQAVSIRRCAPFARLAAHRASSSAAKAPASSMPKADATSTTSARGAR
jgi:hypothetical protein